MHAGPTGRIAPQATVRRRDFMMSTTRQAPEPPSTRRRRIIVSIVAGLSTVIAIVLGVVQERPLGDDPVVMIACGCLLAAVAGVLRVGKPVLPGFASMAGFPAWALIDLALHGGHNMLPFEFAFYAAYGGLGVAVAAIAKRCRD